MDSQPRTFCQAHTFMSGLPSITVAQMPPWPYAVGMYAVEFGPGHEGLRVDSWSEVVKSWSVVDPDAVVDDEDEVRMTSDRGAMVQTGKGGTGGGR